MTASFTVFCESMSHCPLYLGDLTRPIWSFYFTRLFLWFVCLCGIRQKTKLCDCWKLWGIITPFLSLHHKHPRNFFRWKMYKITILKNMTRILDPVTCPPPKYLLWSLDFFIILLLGIFPVEDVLFKIVFRGLEMAFFAEVDVCLLPTWGTAMLTARRNFTSWKLITKF